jgi:magnesium transporter
LLTGLAIGMTLAVMALPIVGLRWGDWDVSLSVSLSLFAACSTATIAAMALPWLFVGLGIDPAFGSGPLATVIQDLLSVVIYFTIATQVLR